MAGLRPPAFWDYGRGGMLAKVLNPAAMIVEQVTARRVAAPGWKAPVPVICCGNAGVGGAGKTTLVMDLADRLKPRAHVLVRGYGGKPHRALRVDAGDHDAAQVGDEALLLSRCAPTWVGADRAQTARAAVAAGAQILLMDDGLQNATLVKTGSLLVIDGASGFGNGRVLPAGPLRETVLSAASRCEAAVLIGADETGACEMLPGRLPVLRASLVPGAEVAALCGKRALAFAGIGRPGKFFSMLENAGVALADRTAFPDHHRYSLSELKGLIARAEALGAEPVTTPKDFVRIPPELRSSFRVTGVSLAWEDEAALGRLLERILAI